MWERVSEGAGSRYAVNNNVIARLAQYAFMAYPNNGGLPRPISRAWNSNCEFRMPDGPF